MNFKNFSVSGVDYWFEHLLPFKVVVPAKEPLATPATLKVTFSHHVFSEKWYLDKHNSETEFTFSGERRVFSLNRYECSVGLRNIIEYQIMGKAFKSRDSNGILRHLFYSEIGGLPYPVFFNLRKADRINGIDGIDGILHIITAYQKPDMPARNRLQSIKFARLVHKQCPPSAK